MTHISSPAYCSPIAQRTPRNSLWSFIKSSIDIKFQRRELARLNDHMLADLGLTREQALKESSRKFWDI